MTFKRIDSFTVEVDADSPGDAVGLAYETDHFQEAPGLCAHCCNAWGNEWQPVIDESEWQADEDNVELIEGER